MFGPYAEYIIPAYGLTFAAFAILVAWTLADYRARRRELAKLEEQGVRRRSQQAPGRADG